ncbi:MAG: hypothetical protein Q7V04_11925 [Deltaproteobacteria bacterium]|nr:hypothetical protein [Deltaproteobacteria bacterium]
MVKIIIRNSCQQRIQGWLLRLNQRDDELTFNLGQIDPASRPDTIFLCKRNNSSVG